ncbi:hypothetical protein [Cetobacterium sp.]|uniref:hypothetical protein n=1 Tax=Cetobacterium sp. TaxID=2071632 RepID=UPI003EE6ABD4
MNKNYLEGINLGIIKENLQKIGFNLKKEKEYYFYNKKEKNVEQLITIITDENKVFHIDMISKHYHVSSDKDIMETNLECILSFVEVGIENLDIKKSLKKGMALLKENEGIKLIEESDFTIRTLNTDCERSIMLSVD